MLWHPTVTRYVIAFCVEYQEEFWRNAEVLDDDMLANVWNWLHLSSKLVEEGTLRGYNSKHPGVRSVIKVDGSSSKSDALSINWSELGSNNCYGAAKIYK